MPFLCPLEELILKFYLRKRNGQWLLYWRRDAGNWHFISTYPYFELARKAIVRRLDWERQKNGI